MSVTEVLVILLVLHMLRMFRWCHIIVRRFKMSLNDKLVNNCFVCILLTSDRFISGLTILGINQTRHHLHTCACICISVHSPLTVVVWVPIVTWLHSKTANRLTYWNSKHGSNRLYAFIVQTCQSSAMLFDEMLSGQVSTHEKQRDKKMYAESISAMHRPCIPLCLLHAVHFSKHSGVDLCMQPKTTKWFVINYMAT